MDCDGAAATCALLGSARWAGLGRATSRSGWSGAGGERVSLEQTQNRISGSYLASNQGVQLPGTVTATLTGIQLAGFRLVQSGFCPGAFQGPAFINEDGSEIVATFTGFSCTGNHRDGVVQLTRR